MSEARTNVVVNVVAVMERNTAVCLVRFIYLPEKLNEMNERLQRNGVVCSAAKYSGMERKEVSE